MIVVNNHMRPISLDGDVMLAAAGTAGATREVASLSDRDRRRYLDTGLISVIEQVTQTQTEAPTSDMQGGSKKGGK